MSSELTGIAVDPSGRAAWIQVGRQPSGRWDCYRIHEGTLQRGVETGQTRCWHANFPHSADP